MKDGRPYRNRADHDLEDKVNICFHKFDIKHEVFFGGKLNGVNCRRLMKNHVDIINYINRIFIEMSKGVVSDLEITNNTDKYKKLINRNG